MKKSVFLCLFLFLFISQFRFNDLSSYKSSMKSIELKGEVVKEQIIEVEKDATVKEILDNVELKETADLSALNLTMNPENQSVIVVPKITKTTKISINSGTLEELDTLSGIGPAVAQRIIDYRAQESFKQLEDLKKVKGIGDKLFDKIKDEICL